MKDFKYVNFTCTLVVRVLLLATLWLPRAFAATGSPISNSSSYPKMIRLEHGPASANGWLLITSNGNVPPTSANVSLSTDNGANFSQISTVPIRSGSTQRCCGTIYEVPQQVGSLQAGTLLYAASYEAGNGTVSAIEIYTSIDQGHTWHYDATPVSGGDVTSHGLWEPSFTVTNDGALEMFWSDETDGCCSQKLAKIRTYDGTAWQDKSNVVASGVQADRPGMAIVSKSSSGSYLMSYEVCGPQNCAVYYRGSADGWNFGDPSSIGIRVQTASGQYFEHAPSNAWSPSALSSSGATLLVGQVLHESNGGVSPQNGQVLLVNLTSDSSGNWYTIAAPVQVPNAFDNFCPNYSSTILPSQDGSRLFEVAADYNNNNQCVTYFAQEAWNSLPADGSTHVFVNQQAGNCLDDYGWGTTDNTAADLWTCTGAAIENWTVHNQGSGYFSIQNQYTGLCVDNTGGSRTAGNPVTLWGCVNNTYQSWLWMDLGNGEFKLQNRAAPLLNLDDTMGSSTPGQQLQIWTDNGLAPQHWVLR